MFLFHLGANVKRVEETVSGSSTDREVSGWEETVCSHQRYKGYR